MSKKSELSKDLEKYLEEATPEELEENWKELEPYNDIGPDATEYINYIKELKKNEEQIHPSRD